MQHAVIYDIRATTNDITGKKLSHTEVQPWPTLGFLLVDAYNSVVFNQTVA